MKNRKKGKINHARMIFAAAFAILAMVFSAGVAAASVSYHVVIPAQGVVPTNPAQPVPITRARVFADYGPSAVYRWTTDYCDGGVSCSGGWSLLGVAWDKSMPYYEIAWGYSTDYSIDLDFGAVTHFTRIIASTYSPNGYSYNGSLLIYTSDNPASGVWTLAATVSLPAGKGVDQSIGPFDTRYIRIKGGSPNYYGSNTVFGVQLLNK